MQNELNNQKTSMCFIVKPKWLIVSIGIVMLYIVPLKVCSYEKPSTTV